MIISRESRKSRESSVPMNMPHTDLTNLTENASLHSRLPSGVYTRRSRQQGRSDLPFVRFVRSV